MEYLCHHSISSLRLSLNRTSSILFVLDLALDRVNGVRRLDLYTRIMSALILLSVFVLQHTKGDGLARKGPTGAASAIFIRSACDRGLTLRKSAW